MKKQLNSFLFIFFPFFFFAKPWDTDNIYSPHTETQMRKNSSAKITFPKNVVDLPEWRFYYYVINNAVEKYRVKPLHSGKDVGKITFPE